MRYVADATRYIYLVASVGCLRLAGRDVDLRPFCYAVFATVEERPFQGRVRGRKWMQASAPVVVFLCDSENGSRGAKAHNSQKDT